MDVVVSGASGFIGSAFTRSLIADGHRVAPLVRPTSRHRGGEAIAWDPERGAIDTGRLERVDAVVHLAGANIGEHKWTPERKRLIVDSRVLGTELLSSTVAHLSQPPAVFVSASAVGYYGNRGDEVLTEESGVGHDFVADLCVQWEDAARPAAEAGLRVVWARMGLVLDGRGGVLARMLLPFRLGLGGRLGTGGQYRSWITLPDAVAAIRRAIDESKLGGPVNVTAPNPVTDAEFATTLGRVLHRPAKLPVPLTPLKWRYGSELVQHLLVEGQRVIPQKLNEAGFEFAHPDLETGLRAVLDGR